MSAGDKTTPPKSAPGNSTDYWSTTRQPLNCLLFLTPLLIVYEAGILFLGTNTGNPEAYRNGADHWMRSALQHLGGTHALLLPALIVIGLIGWHLVGRYRWRASPEMIIGMLVESLLYASCLVLLGELQDLAFRQLHTLQAGYTMNVMSSDMIPQFISYIGAGVYEETLFRLCLLPICYGLWRLALLPHKPAVVAAILFTSVLFSTAHYIGPGADQFTTFSFLFRAIAGAFFAILFVLRGFGITAGCHAAYDILVGILLATQTG